MLLVAIKRLLILFKSSYIFMPNSNHLTVQSHILIFVMELNVLFLSFFLTYIIYQTNSIYFNHDITALYVVRFKQFTDGKSGPNIENNYFTIFQVLMDLCGAIVSNLLHKQI